MKGSTGHNSTKKAHHKAINASHDNMNFHTFDASLGTSTIIPLGDSGSQN